MEDKKLHRLNKTELLWIIRDQEAELEELRAYVQELGGDPNRNFSAETTGQEQPADASQTDEGDAS